MYQPEGYNALREAAAVVRRRDRGVLRVTGTERLVWLQGLLTNDVSSPPKDGAVYSAYLTPQGRMITDLRVIERESSTLLDVPAPLAAALHARLDALLFAEDATITNASSEQIIVDLHGPEAPRMMSAVGAFAATAVRDDQYALPGFTFVVGTADEEALVQSLRHAGAIETTLATLDVVRIEAGRPAFLVDMDEHTIPLEAGIEQRAISFTKGCYVGQEVIVRVTQRGQGRVAKKLVGLTFARADVPTSGSSIFAGDRQIGSVTSTTWSPRLEHAIALGYVHRDFVTPGTAVEVDALAGRLTATVAPLPFVAA